MQQFVLSYAHLYAGWTNAWVLEVCVLVYKHYLDHVRNLTNINMPPLSNETPRQKLKLGFPPAASESVYFHQTFFAKIWNLYAEVSDGTLWLYPHAPFLSSLKLPERIKTERKREFHYTGAPGEGH